MRSFNHVALLGVAGKEAELRYFQNGDPIAICSLATNEYYKDKQTGEKQQTTQWHNLVFRGPIAEHAARMIDKGAKMFVTGMVKYQTKRKQDGTYANYTNIVVDHWTLLDSTVTQPTSSNESPPSGQAIELQKHGNQMVPKNSVTPSGTPSTQPGFDDFGDDDIPF